MTKSKSKRRESKSRRGDRGLDPPSNNDAASSIGSIFLEDSEELALKQRESTDVTVPDFNLADYDLGEDYSFQDHCDELTSECEDKRSSQDYGEGESLDAVDTTAMTTRTYSYSELVATLGSDSEHLKSMHPRLHRRVRDFRFARRKRREKQGTHKPWGIFGLYAHLSDIRIDLEWAEDAAWRRENGEPYLSWADYEKARNKGMNRPLFSYLTVFICTVMMIVTFSLNDWKIEPLSVNPLIGPSAEVLIQAGARDTALIVNEGQWFRLISPIVLHGGVIHFVINMMALWFIGAAVEQSHGFASAAILFFIPAVGGNILSAIFLPQYISVGASGGIFGLIGGCVADVALNWNLLFIKGEDEDDVTKCQHWSAFFWLFADIVANAILGLTPFVDNFTHLGGLLYGLCCGISTIERLAVGFFGVGTGRCSRIRNSLVRFCGLIFSVFLIMITTVLLVGSDGATSPCPSCRYVSCVPFPFGAENKWWNCDDCDFAVADLVKLHATSVAYDRIDLTCPDGEIALIDITTENISDREEARGMLPKFCRDHCADVFSN
ncbi:Inactive rhomboid protein 1 [Seminavis robusta]|uniref:rhomboid protease n=1 Tax=Seminavis robusta TaxID=568900 RepID=A0A9N8HMM5_9STRA|nr:Inactive rhomboid protein 1 [Seminavis robusta]|eukprot:Sro758_g198020.1 Inactive rhomboid protein 1 (551) ;mRNA; f:15314-16966